jgi:undecaprenyl-diphosphatase
MRPILNYLKKHVNFILIGGLLLVLFYVFSFAVKEDLFTRFDFDMTVRIQNEVPRSVDRFLSYFSLVGSFEGTLVILVVLILITRKIKSFLLIGAFGVMHVVELVGKAFLDHPGTPFMFHRYSFDFVFPSGHVQPGGSYPSGHSMRSVYLAIVLIYIVWRAKKIKKTLRYVICSFTAIILLIMLVSRVSLGEHWMSDVIGGALIGMAFAFLSLILV